MEYHERFSLYLFIYFAFNTINHIDNFNIILLFLLYTIFFFPGACVQDSDFFISGAFVNYLFIFCPNNKFISRIRSRDGISYSLQNQMPRDSQDFALHTTPVFANVYANRLADGISFGAIAQAELKLADVELHVLRATSIGSRETSGRERETHMLGSYYIFQQIVQLN